MVLCVLFNLCHAQTHIVAYLTILEHSTLCLYDIIVCACIIHQFLLTLIIESDRMQYIISQGTVVLVYATVL